MHVSYAHALLRYSLCCPANSWTGPDSAHTEGSHTWLLYVHLLLLLGARLVTMRSECAQQLCLQPEVSCQPARGAEYDADGAYARHIAAAAAGAAAALLARVTRGGALQSALGALKAYLLLARGDTLTTFLDTADAELARPAAELSASRLQSLLELGARGSRATHRRAARGWHWLQQAGSYLKPCSASACRC